MKNFYFLDNYDSFTYNLVHIIEQIIGNRIDVFQNDKISIDEIENTTKLYYPQDLVFQKKQDTIGYYQNLCFIKIHIGNLLRTTSNCRGIWRKSFQFI